MRIIPLTLSAPAENGEGRSQTGGRNEEASIRSENEQQNEIMLHSDQSARQPAGTIKGSGRTGPDERV